MYKLDAILAVDIKNGLAKNGQIPWNCKKDISFFKNMTINNVVIMGSKTFISLPKSLPLNKRLNIVVTRDQQYYKLKYSGYENILFLNKEQLVKVITNPFDFITETQLKYLNKDFTMFVIGGNQLYNMLFPYCKTIWLSTIKKNYDCDLTISTDFNDFVNREVIYDDDELNIIKMLR